MRVCGGVTPYQIIKMGLGPSTKLSLSFESDDSSLRSQVLAYLGRKKTRLLSPKVSVLARRVVKFYYSELSPLKSEPFKEVARKW